MRWWARWRRRRGAFRWVLPPGTQINEPGVPGGKGPGVMTGPCWPFTAPPPQGVPEV